MGITSTRSPTSGSEKPRLRNHRLAIETGSYVRPYKKPNEGVCPLCKKEAEDEKHLVSCSVYQEKRNSLFECSSKKFKIPIVKMSTENIFLLLLTPPPPSNNVELQKIIAKHMHDCYEIRTKNVVYSSLTLKNRKLSYCKFRWTIVDNTMYKASNKVSMYVCKKR